MLKMSDNPPIRSPWAESIEEFTGQWWVAQTKARAEKAFAWSLLKRDIGHFLPMVERVKISGGRKRRLMLPLFNSYVFFCGTEDDRYQALTTNRLCQTIEVPEQQVLVNELLMIEKALSCDVTLDPYPFAVVGKRCRVTAGPFVGLEGTVIERSKPSRLVLEVGILGQGASMEVDADLLEPSE